MCYNKIKTNISLMILFTQVRVSLIIQDLLVWKYLQSTNIQILFDSYIFWNHAVFFKTTKNIISVADSLDRRGKMKPSVMITSPGSPDITTIHRPHHSTKKRSSCNSSVGGRIQVRIIVQHFSTYYVGTQT